MKTLILLSILSFATFTLAQHAGYNPQSVRQHQESTRPANSGVPEIEVAKAEMAKGSTTASPRLPHADAAKLKEKADELASLAQGIPTDVDQTANGILPKDLDQRLRRIEKLAKQLRSGISH